MHPCYQFFIVLSVIVFAMVYLCALVLRVRRGFRAAVALVVAGALFMYMTWEHHFPKLPGFVPPFDTLALSTIYYADEYPIHLSYQLYNAQYERQSSADEVVAEIEERLRESPDFESVSVKLNEWHKEKSWQVTAMLSKRERMPAGGGCRFDVSTESRHVGLVVFRLRPWL